MSMCDDFRILIPLFLDDELTGSELQNFQTHIEDCNVCREHLEEERALSQLLHRIRPLYHAPEHLRSRVNSIVASGVYPGLRAPERLRRRVSGIQSFPQRGAWPAFRWPQLAGVGLVVALLFLFVPQIVQRVHAEAFVETAAATQRSYVAGNLPMEIHTSSPAEVTAWFAGKVPFHFQLPDSQQPSNGQQTYRLVGARLVNFRGTYAALTTYQMQEQKISLLVVSDRSARAEGGDVVQSGRLMFHNHNVDSLRVITWSHRGLTYALVSALPGSAEHSCLVCHQNMADHQEFSQHP
jgi:anti-sigma factor (TIGR02949 family)